MSLSDADFEIDWSTEPATDRERRIRAALLRHALADDIGKLGYLWELLAMSTGDGTSLRPTDAANDFQAAFRQAKAEFEARRRLRHRQVLLKAIQEVDHQTQG